MLKNNVPIPQGLLQVGTTLTHDIYDRTGKLLLRQGVALESEVMIARLEGMGFFDPEAMEAMRGAAGAHEAAVQVGYRPDRSGISFSVFSELDAACRDLAALFADESLALEPGIAAIAEGIGHCCSVDSDASIASLFLALPHPYPIRHAVNSATLAALLLARRKDDPARSQLAVCAALTMDIGKRGSLDGSAKTPPGVGDVDPTHDRRHPTASVEALLARSVHSPLWLAVVSQHHEALDGTGYPGGLQGEKILPEAQVLALADCYCAMVSAEPGRAALPATQALKDLHVQHAKAFAPALMGTLIATLGVYPPGTIVRLANGETAVVGHRLLDPKHPIVYALCGPSGFAYDVPKKRQTNDQAGHAIERCLPPADCKLTVDREKLWPPTLTADRRATAPA